MPDERAASLEAKLLQAFGARHTPSAASPTRHLETGLVAAGAVAWFAWAVGTLGALSG